jgi:serine phosphatase RsbU (regulator of sigma subunit)
MTALAHSPVDYRELMKKVERLVETIASADDVEQTVNLVADGIISHFREKLGIYGGRLYRRQQGEYVLRATFGEAKEIEPGLRVPRSYPPIDACLSLGVVYVEPGDPGVDRALEEQLGVHEFACIEVGDDAYILAFNIAPAASREDVIFSLQILRNAINQKISEERLDELFREARKIQASILPRRVPAFAPFDLAGRTEPMESVGGDFFDFIPITGKILGLAIADVSGHGLSAALQVRDIHMGLRMGMARDFKIVRTVERLNEIIHHSTITSRFVALFYGELESRGNFIYVNAGHIAPFHMKANGEVFFLEAGGAVLGPLPDISYERGFVTLEAGDLLVFFTDGIVETRRDGYGEELGVTRLLEVVHRVQSRRAAEVVEAIFEEVEAFGGDSPADDDRTVMVVKYPEPGG